MHVAGVFVSCMSSVPRAFMCTPNSRAALTIHAKLFTFTRVKSAHARVCTHACVKFKVSGTVHTYIHTYVHTLVSSMFYRRWKIKTGNTCTSRMLSCYINVTHYVYT